MNKIKGKIDYNKNYCFIDVFQHFIVILINTFYY